jgi:hypothetical protein
MSSSVLWSIGLTLAAVVVFASGFRLRAAGRPYAGWLVNVHKLVDLAGIVGIAVLVYRASSEVSPAGWVLVAVAAALLIALLVTGGLLSAIEEPPPRVLAFHRIAPWIAVMCAVAVVYFTVV